MTPNLSSILSLTLLALSSICITNPATAFDPRAEPEGATSSKLNNSPQSKVVKARYHMVVAANPHASEAGRAILRRGGTAIDAAIAVQMVLNLVEPQSSGIGGGAFLLHWSQNERKLTSFDGRETAPLAAKPTRFMKNGKPMKFREAVPGGLSVGTPGVLKMLEKIHKRHGRLPWAQLFDPAIKLSIRGFALSPRLYTLLKKADAHSFNGAARAYFFDKTGSPKPVGTILKNPAFAQALKGIARYGADYFYHGPLAKQIAKAVQTSHANKGDMTPTDLATYKALERSPICVPYRTYHVCGMGPPSSGMLTIAQVLKIIEPFYLGRIPLNRTALHLIAEAEKLAYADRKRYMADHDFIEIPQGLLDARYLTSRRALIKPTKTMGKAKPGTPVARQKRTGIDATTENNGTSHISIIDVQGNAISMTSSIEGAFGARLMVSGFLLNNELTDFSFRPKDKQGSLIANRVEPLKRPRSSMAPTMIFDRNGRLHMVVGSPGGSRIILYVLKIIIGHINWGLDAKALIEIPNFGSRNGPLELEKGPGVQMIDTGLQTLGHKNRITTMTSGVHLILHKENALIGAADPRREGVPLGD
ncbi:MAG: gamma-glutamyltransferase [bacterium]|nr:gamma-glutamyltransferase [bacterium]